MQENEIQIRVNREIEKFLSNPINIIQAYDKALKAATQEIQEMKPKADIWDLAMGSDCLKEMSAVAKVLNFRNMGRNNLFEYLKDKKILRYNNEPYQQYVDTAYFKSIEQTVKIDGYIIINNKTMVTQKGINYIAKLLLEDGYAVNER